MSVLSIAPPGHVVVDTIARPSHRSRELVLDATLVVAGAVFVAAMAKIAFFIGPIPITGQTLGVLLVGAALGSRRGALSLTAYALAGLAGLPVFAGAVAGPLYALMPSFGFVLGFIPAAFVAGWFAERAWDRRPVRAFTGFVIASIVPFLIGVPYMALVLSAASETEVAFALLLDVGVMPFIIPGLFKAALTAAILALSWVGVREFRRSER